MKASDLAKGDSERNAAESSLLRTETTDAVNTGLVGSADKSKKMLKENGFERVSRKSSSDSPNSLATSKNTDAEDVLKDSGAEVDDLVAGSDGTSSQSRLSELSGDAAETVTAGSSSRLASGMKYARNVAIAGAIHKTLEGTELDGVDEAYYKGKGAYRLGRKAVNAYQKRRQTQAAKRAIDSVGEKKYQQKKSSQVIQREAQRKRNQMTSRAIQTEKATRSTSLASTTATGNGAVAGKMKAISATAANVGGGGGILVGGGALLLLLFGFFLVFILFMAIIGALVDSDSNSTGSLSTTEIAIVAYLQDLGYSNEAIAAVLGNVAAESLADPADEHTAYESGSLRIVCGAFQFTSVYGSGTGNYYKFKSWCSENGYDWTDITVQVEFLFSSDSPGYLGSSWSTNLAKSYYSNCTDYESRFGTDYYRTAALFKEADDVDLATYSFMACYERPSNGTTAQLDVRLYWARYYLNILESGGVTSVTDDATRQAILTAAYYVANVYATPYVLGGSDIVNGCDCSYFTQWCYAQAGISIPRTTEAQVSAGTLIPISEAEPGDLLWMPGHIGIYAGGTTVIEQTPTYCRVTSLSYQDWVYAVTFS